MIDKTLTNFTQTLLTKSNRVSGKYRKQEFRGSALPICPVKWVLNDIVHDSKLPEEESLGLDFFAGIGVQVHTVLQRWSGYHGQLYGDWELTWNKSKVIEGKTYTRKESRVLESRIGPIWHENGKVVKVTEDIDTANLTQAVYKELTVREPVTGLTGHVDGLLPYKDGFIVLDFKTSSMKKLSELDSPPINYHHQIHTYWYLLEKYGPWDWKPFKHRGPLKIYGSVIFMLSRDNPFDKDNGIKMFVSDELDMASVESNFKNYRIAQKALKTGDFSKAVKYRICRCIEDTQGCEFAQLGCVVSKEKLLKNINEQWETKNES